MLNTMIVLIVALRERRVLLAIPGGVYNNLVVNTELEKLFKEDQDDRLSAKADWENRQFLEYINRRDQNRRKKVKQMIEKGLIEDVSDYHHAAMIFQHGNGPEDFHKANELAKKAMELGDQRKDTRYYKEVRWLYAASMDRWLLSLGKAQKYGTQFVKESEGEWGLKQPIDPDITDEERVRYFVPPLSEAVKRFKEKY